MSEAMSQGTGQVLGLDPDTKRWLLRHAGAAARRLP